MRFLLAIRFNRSSFPKGTSIANILGTAVLGLVFSLSRNTGVRCYIVRGLMDGFCGK